METRYNTLNKVLNDPSEIGEIMKDPGKFGLDFWNELSNKERSYIAFAAGAGLILYGIFISRQQDK